MQPGSEVHIPLTVRPTSRRGVEERLAIRFPAAAAAISRFVLLLPPRSRLRQAALRHNVRQGLEAYNRGDYEALRPSYHDDLELISEPEAVDLGFEPAYRGFEGWLQYARRWNAEWGSYQARPEELIDLGDGRLLAVGHQEARGSGSGANTSKDWATLWKLSAGRIIREQYFFDHAQAFRAAGLDR